MENISVKNIVEATGGRLLCGNGDTVLRHLSIDSRQTGADTLFIPLIGERTDAHAFITQALEGGAAASLTSEHESAPDGFTGALIRVDDTKKALQDIGRYLRDRISIPIVGITGSVGKTTTREMVAAALSAGFKTFRTPANHNGQLGVPLTLSAIEAEDEIGVLEMGMSEPGEMEIIASIARPSVAVMTNIGVTHIENLGSRENILREKLHIQDGMRPGGALIINGDDDLLSGVKALEGCRTISYGLGADCDYRAEEITVEGGLPSFILICKDERISVRLSVPGEHNIRNALAALAVADFYGVSLTAAAGALEEYRGFKNRQQIVQADGITIIDDTYNASPDSMRAGLQVLSSMEASRHIAVLADMKELGKDTLLFHRETGKFAAGLNLSLLVTFGELARAIAEGAVSAGLPEASVICFGEEKREDMITYLKKELRKGDAVLFKGSNSMHLGEAAARFIPAGKQG